MPATRGKGPDARDPVAALAFDRPDFRTGTPGQHRAGVVTEDRMRHRQIEIGCRHRAAAGLAQAPRRRCIGLRDGLGHMEEGDGIGLDPVRRAWQQQPEQPRLMELVEQCWRQPPRALDLARRRANGGTDVRGARDHGGIAGKIGQRRGRRVREWLFCHRIDGHGGDHFARDYARRTTGIASGMPAVAASSRSICSIDLPLVSMPRK